MAALAELGIRVRINGSPERGPRPDSVHARIATHAAYDPDAAQRFWRVLVQADRVLKQFRTGFLGKVSPVHFFWGSFDLAVTRFSGRRHRSTRAGSRICRMRSPARPIRTRSAAPASGRAAARSTMPAFYSYAYPTPEGFAPRRCGRRRRSSTRPWASSSCPTMPSGPPMPRTRRSWTSSRPPTRRRRTRRAGIAPRSTARRVGPGCRGRSSEAKVLQ